MTQTTTKLYSLSYGNARTYLVTALFIAGNISLPQLFHLAPNGGATWLPIYFFTLVGAYKYGWRVGLLTALLSPSLNNVLFGMPPAHALTAITVKSVLLALAAGYAAAQHNSVTLTTLALVVLSYQCAGTLCEWALTGSLSLAAQDFRMGVPGMFLQVLGGYMMIRYVLRK